MALPVENRFPVVPNLGSSQQSTALRTQRSVGQQQSDSAQNNAQAFINTLPATVRDQIGSSFQDRAPQNQFGNAQNTQTQSLRQRNLQGQIFNNQTFSRSQNSEQRTYSAPIFSANAALIQAQSFAQDETAQQTLTSFQREEFFGAYVTAGAQPGGEKAVREAQIRQQERDNKLFIVPPVITSVNFLT